MHLADSATDEGGASAHPSEVRCPAHSCPHPGAGASALGGQGAQRPDAGCCQNIYLQHNMSKKWPPGFLSISTPKLPHCAVYTMLH